MFATLFYEVRSTGVTHGTELFVLHAAIKAIFSLAAEGSHYEVFPRKKDLMDNDQSPEFKFKFVFFPLQMLRFSALCG